LKRAYFELIVRPAIREAAVVLTVSEFSRAAICEWAKVSSAKIVNVGNGLSTIFTDQGDRFASDRPYLLYVGNHKPHKNLYRLMQAFARSKLAGEFKLLMTGSASSSLAGEISQLGLSEHVNFIGHASDQDLAKLYRGAAGVVLVSLYEGFGLPIIESMACGTPVITSNCTSMKEIADGAAILVDPCDVDAIAQALATLIANRDMRAELITRGWAVAGNYSWDRTAQRVRAALAQQLA